MAIGSKPLIAQNESGEWRALGLQGRIVQKLRLHDRHLYATTDNGLYRKDLRTTDTLWTPIGLQGKRARALLVFAADTLLASTEFDTVSLYRTTDAGATWSSYQNGFGGESSETVMAIERHPDQPNVLFATGATVVAKSTDRGTSWQISHGSWRGFATGINFVAIDTNDSKIVWAGGQNAIEEAFLLKSEDTGATWREWPRIVDDVSVAKTVAIHPYDSKTIYAGLESYMLKTTDGGETWEEILAEDGRFFFGIAINPARPARMYAASWFKTFDPQPLILYISDNGGESWRVIPEDTAQFGGVWDLLYVNKGTIDKLYLGLWKGGVYEFVTDLTTSVDDDPPVVSTFKLEQNYPNPANPETIISFSLPETGMATLKIYDALGREVATLINRVMSAGAHEIRWRSHGLASGVYFYRLQTEKFRAVRKMLILE
jgi:photosystem II stability/assembly factor-like uncharacterized protein